MTSSLPRELAGDRSRTPSLEDRIEEFKRLNPEVQTALDLFNISSQQYEAAISAVQSTRTYVTTSTLLPGQNG